MKKIRLVLVSVFTAGAVTFVSAQTDTSMNYNQDNEMNTQEFEFDSPDETKVPDDAVQGEKGNFDVYNNDTTGSVKGRRKEETETFTKEGNDLDGTYEFDSETEESDMQNQERERYDTRKEEPMEDAY